MLTLPAPVVDVAWLRNHLGDPALRVADVPWSSDPARPAATGPEP